VSAPDTAALREAHKAAVIRTVNMMLKCKRFCIGEETDYHRSLKSAWRQAQQAEADALAALRAAGGEP
jgi:hypothetical protein